MPSTMEAVGAIVRHLGFDPARAKAVARSLTEDGSLPAGAPGRSPELKPEHVIDLVLGCAVDAPLRAIAPAVGHYRAMLPGGANLETAPASVVRTAGEALDIWADIALHGDSDVLRSDLIEIATNWGEVAIHAGGVTTRFVPAGTLATHWRDSGHRRSVTINGAALVDCLHSLFGENHDR